LHWAIQRGNIEISRFIIMQMRHWEEESHMMDESFELRQVADDLRDIYSSDEEGEENKLDGSDALELQSCSSLVKIRRKVASVELLDIKNRCGHTPFFTAIIKGHLVLAEMLLQHRMSSINVKDE
jgi:hypothetical protein